MKKSIKLPSDREVTERAIAMLGSMITIFSNMQAETHKADKELESLVIALNKCKSHARNLRTSMGTERKK